MIILGAGMAGLLTGAILRDKATTIIEAQPDLPNNHHAVLRFRSSVVGDSLNIKFKEVEAVKTVLPWKNKVASALAYSYKTTGSYHMRSLLSANDEKIKRYIAPNDFLERMRNCVMAKIYFNKKIEMISNSKIYCESVAMENKQPIISTLPMPLLMTILNYDGERPEKFDYKSGWVITATIHNCESYFSMYVPDPYYHFYRISITGDKLIIEFSEGNFFEDEKDVDLELNLVKNILGLEKAEISNIKLTKQKYAKILPISEHTRKKFILWATETHNVYSIGRFATWRPGLLLDDIVNDVRVIQEIASSKHNYDQRKKS